MNKLIVLFERPKGKPTNDWGKKLDSRKVSLGARRATSYQCSEGVEGEKTFLIVLDFIPELFAGVGVFRRALECIAREHEGKTGSAKFSDESWIVALHDTSGEQTTELLKSGEKWPFILTHWSSLKDGSWPKLREFISVRSPEPPVDPEGKLIPTTIINRCDGSIAALWSVLKKRSEAPSPMPLLSALSILCQGYLAVCAKLEAKMAPEERGNISGALRRMGWDQSLCDMILPNDDISKLDGAWWKEVFEGIGTAEQFCAQLGKESRSSVPSAVEALVAAIYGEGIVKPGLVAEVFIAIADLLDGGE